MKTTFTPPPITPGPWKVFTPQNGKGQTLPERIIPDRENKGTGIIATMGISVEGRRDANSKFMCAAPAMAEALVRALDALEYFAMEFNMTSGGLPEECRNALLSAGYTEAAADQ